MNKDKEVDYFDGISFAPTLLGKKKQKEHDFLYWEFNETNQIGVRMGDWKMVVSAAMLAGVLSILTSVAGLPEVTIETIEEE